MNSIPHRHILNMRVDALTYSAAAERITSWAQAQEARYVCVANVHMAMETVDDPEFRTIVNRADLVTPDGMPLVWMLRKLGVSDAERIYGPELVLRVCASAEKQGIPIGLFGGTDERLGDFKRFLAKRFPELDVACAMAPPFRPLTPEEDEQAVNTINHSGAQILFVGIGCPKQERFMHAHRYSIGAVQIGVGAAFDFHSGHVRQAPSWIGSIGLEWFFRLMMEPRRLWKRYLKHNPRFVLRSIRQLMNHRSESVPA